MKFSKIIESSNDAKITIASSRPIKPKVGSKLIMFYQKTSYSHVLVIINDVVFQASHGFVNSFHIDEFLKENIIVDKLDIEKSICDFNFLFSTLGKKYGYIQNLKIASKYLLLTKLKIIKYFKYRDNGDKYLICSEYVGKFLKLDWVNDLTDPQDIISYLLKTKKL